MSPKNVTNQILQKLYLILTLAMYGGAENQEAMIQRNVPIWLFPLAFHSDDTIKYFACLAIGE